MSSQQRRSGLIASGSSSLTPTAVKTAAYTAVVGDIAMMNVAGGATALTLPTAPADKSQVGYRAIGATTAVPLVITAGGTDTIGTAGATTASVPLADEVAVLQYQAASTRWLAVGNVKTQVSLDARYGQIAAANVWTNTQRVSSGGLEVGNDTGVAANVYLRALGTDFGGRKWELGIDTSNHGGGKDFFIATVASDGNTVTDRVFLNYGPPFAMGVGITPPDGTHKLEVATGDSGTSGMGGLRLIQVAATTPGNYLTCADSGGTARIFVDSGGVLRGNNSSVGGLVAAPLNDASSTKSLLLGNAGLTQVYGWVWSTNTGTFLKLRDVTGGIDMLTLESAGAGIQIMQSGGKIGFYGTTPIAQRTSGAVTSGFVAGAGSAVDSAATFTGATGSTAYTIGDVVKALKQYGLLTT